jgi:hypothetical protein
MCDRLVTDREQEGLVEHCSICLQLSLCFWQEFEESVGLRSSDPDHGQMISCMQGYSCSP